MNNRKVPSAVRPRGSGRIGRRNLLGQRLGEKGGQTRQRLLDAVVELTKTTSIRNLRVAQIARLADASPATFYVYFRDVYDAVLALAQRTTQSAEDLLALLADSWEQDADAKASAFVAKYVAHWQANAAIFRIRNLASEEGEVDFYMARVNAVVPLIELMAVRLRDRARTIGLDSRALAGVLLSMIETISQFGSARPVLGISPEKMMQVGSYFLALFVGGPRSAGFRTAAPPRRLVFAPDETGRRRSADHGATLGAKGQRTRARVIEATRTLLATHSLRELGTADIAKAAGISKGTFYEYFNDAPDAVLVAVDEATDMEPLNASLRQVAAASGPSLGAYEFLNEYIEWSRDRSAVIRVRNVAADEGDIRFLKSRITSAGPLLRTLASSIADRQREGTLPAHLDGISTAGCVLAMSERLAVAIAHDLVPGVTARNMVEAGAQVLSVLLGGEPLAFSRTRPHDAEADVPALTG